MQVRRQDATRELELRGTAAELHELAGIMLSEGGSAELDRAGDPAPYGRNLSRVVVVRSSGPVVLRSSVESDVLDIRGGGAQLGLLAANVRGFADEGDATRHLHVDYYPEHDYLDESSGSMVVALAG